MPSRGIRNRAMRVFLVMGNLAEVHAKNFLRRRVIHRSCGEQLLRALLASMNNSGTAISRAPFPRAFGGGSKMRPDGTKLARLQVLARDDETGDLRFTRELVCAVASVAHSNRKSKIV